MSADEHLTKIYKLLAAGLLDIRVASHEGEARAAFELADLLHNIPLRLERERQDGTDYKSTLDWLKMRAEQKNLEKWLASRSEQ